MIVSRLVEQKNLLKVVSLFNHLKLPLTIVGTGKFEQQLKAISGPNITFVGLITDEQLATYYAGCKALIYFHEEDFGLVPLEAQSFGKPVLALSRGGAIETVLHGSTGMLLDTIADLSSALQTFDSSIWDSDKIKKHAQTFGFSRFREQFLTELGKL